MDSELNFELLNDFFIDVDFFDDIDQSKKNNNKSFKRQERFNKIIENRKAKRVEEHKRRRIKNPKCNLSKHMKIPNLNVIFCNFLML